MSREHATILSTRKPQDNFLTAKSTNDLSLDLILHTISQLEHYLIEDHLQDCKLRMALDKQKERILDLYACLGNEKQRNQRLVELILSKDSCISEEEDFKSNDFKFRWPGNSAKDAYASISPLLMQQRYDELSSSYNQCRKQLLRKDNDLKKLKCEKELLLSQCDHLLDEFKQNQKRLEEMCVHCLRLQKTKNFKIQQLEEALTYANNCIITAQQIIDYFDVRNFMDLQFFKHDFQQNLQLFLNTLRLSKCTYCSCYTDPKQIEQN